MPGPADILRELHRLHKHIRDLATEIDRGPAALKAHQAKLAKQDELFREAQESLRRLKVSIHENEVSLRAKHQQIAKYERQLNEAASKKEYDALQLEIANERKECQRLETAILEGMEEVDRRTSHLPEMEKEVQRVKRETALVIDDIQTRRNTLTDLLQAARKNLQEVEATLPPDVKALYDRLTAAHNEDALSGVQGRICTACYTEITAQNYNELLQGRFVLCKSCGRMVYLAEETS